MSSRSKAIRKQYQWFSHDRSCNYVLLLFRDTRLLLPLVNGLQNNWIRWQKVDFPVGLHYTTRVCLNFTIALVSILYFNVMKHFHERDVSKLCNHEAATYCWKVWGHGRRAHQQFSKGGTTYLFLLVFDPILQANPVFYYLPWILCTFNLVKIRQWSKRKLE